MNVLSSATTFHVKNLDISLLFYCDKLGFVESFRFGDYAGVEYGDLQIHLSGPKSTNKRKAGEGGIYIRCDDVDSYYEEVISKGVITQTPPMNHKYGMRDFVIEDPDGNLIGVGQELK